MQIDELEISYRTWNALRKAGFKDTSDLTCKTERHILDIRGIGHVAIRELREALAEHNLRMGKTGPAYNRDT